jgi:hypothetical protein
MTPSTKELETDVNQTLCKMILAFLIVALVTVAGSLTLGSLKPHSLQATASAAAVVAGIWKAAAAVVDLAAVVAVV